LRQETFVKILRHHRVTVFYRIWCALFYMENDAELFPAHYTWKVAAKGFKMACLIISCEIILQNIINFFGKNYCEI
jgi:hypothetical protein